MLLAVLYHEVWFPLYPRAPARPVVRAYRASAVPYRSLRASDETVVQAGELDKANPWLRRTQWAQYLQGIPVRLLSEAIATPDPDTEGPEGIVYAI
ncbi:uncharacterized protein N7477_001244 [Penicillium maclennaniae]|uniref:uncharacterized protein n=1 Tax=Penicillium maclennaniae TaxID=1343394 RepID=UPI0025425887|nr:uncharacterized protein N7477_001244 [Penicillium maclennaniae]KAJ5681304.1 hypothetical protein N7477_001244 [Penicillium maclennaniae]